jgi:hypothetical protein
MLVIGRANAAKMTNSKNSAIPQKAKVRNGFSR